jgi:hypothetical protein
MIADFIEVPVIDGGPSVRIPVPPLLRVLDGVVPPPRHGIFQVMNRCDGDKRVVWNSDSLAEIQAAKEMFDNLKKEGLTPYRVGVGGKAMSDKMDEFDPMAEQVLFLPLKLAKRG